MGQSAAPTSLSDARARRIERESDLGSWLEGLRVESGLNKEEAAQAAGIDARSLRRYENAGDVPGGLTLLRLLSTYGVSLSQPPPQLQPGAVNAELAEMNDALDELREGMALLLAGSSVGRSQVLVRLVETGGPELREELRGPLLKLARQEREAGELMIEQAELLEARLA